MPKITRHSTAADLLKGETKDVVIDSEGKIVSINPIAEEILEIQKEDTLSKYLSEVFSTSMPELAFELQPVGLLTFLMTMIDYLTVRLETISAVGIGIKKLHRSGAKQRLCGRYLIAV